MKKKKHKKKIDRGTGETEVKFLEVQSGEWDTVRKTKENRKATRPLNTKTSVNFKQKNNNNRGRNERPKKQKLAVANNQKAHDKHPPTHRLWHLEEY